MNKMHANEFEIDDILVRDLIKKQAPQWSDLSLRRVQSSGTDNALFRLGNDYIVRLPRVEQVPGCVHKSIDKEYKWISQIAQHLSTPISEPVFKGSPNNVYPWPWMVMKWHEGNNPDFEKNNEYHAFAKALADFLNQLHCVKLANGPASRRGVPLIHLDEQTRQAISELEREVDIAPPVNART